ncbi:unnamed protein product, partial [Mesorhabditis belari]|uniref:Uncharacterized protein n=1 Tax=Mesorhabditis belari TaxID=2138241 RepID=A0AAF3J1N9_9BILA
MLGSAVSAGGSAIGPSTSSAYSTWYDEAIFVPRNIRATRVLPPKTLPEEFEQRQINRVTFWKSEPTTTIKPHVSRSRLLDRRTETRIGTNSTSKTDLPESFPLQEIDESSVHSPELAATCATYAQTISSTNSYGAFRMSDGKLSNHTMRRGALFCRSGTWLEILDEKESRRRHRHRNPELVRGNTHTRSEFSILNFISVAFGLVSIRGEKSDRFLCMDEQSRLYAAHPSNYSAECVFLEEMLENYYNLYSSCAHFPDPNDKTFKPWYVAIRKDGRPRRGRHSRKRRRSSHFLVIHFDVADPLPVNVDVTRVVSSSIRHSSRGNEIDERKWFSPAVPPPPTVPTNLQTDYLSQLKDEKPKKKKRRKEERLRKEKEEREKRAKEIEEKRLGEVEKQREQQEEVERKRMAQKMQQWGGGGYSRFRGSNHQSQRRTPEPPLNTRHEPGAANSQSKTYFTYSSG